MNEVLRETSVRTTCPYCGVGCGVVATRRLDGTVQVAGDPEHPANFGRLCSKGTALADTLGLDGRLLHPSVDGRRVTWDAALTRVATRFGETIAEHGPDSVAFYVSGQLLTEDYYLANKLMKGFVGSANIDTNSRLCMASSVAGHRRAFGADTVPGCYEDLETADLVVLVGSNLAWCHPVTFQRVLAAREARAGGPSPLRLVVVDPRRTVTAEAADLHLPLAPETDIALYLGLLRALETGGRIDAGFVAAHVDGLEAALAEARGFDPARVAEVTGLAPADVARFFDLVVGTEKTVTVYSQGVNQSARGVDKVAAILATHLATGRIGKPGTGPFSITGQPNAMGGREVGGLANQLASHLDLESAAHRTFVRDFWNAPTIAERAGLKAVDLFQAVADGRIKALWVMATNPAVSLPDADAVAAALDLCPFVVVSDVEAATDTVRRADVLLPALAWGEKDGTVTNSERRISRQRGFRPAPGEARPDWWIIREVGRRMGFADAFDHDGPAAIFDEYARLSAAAAAAFGRDLDLAGLVGLGPDGYDRLAPVQWPVTADGAGRARFFAAGGFFTPGGRARLHPVGFGAEDGARAEAGELTLNTGRVRDHWHTMTRTGRSARLSAHIGEPYLEIAPADAARHGLAPADVARVTSPTGAALLRVLVTERQRPGSVFAPMHWTAETASLGRVDALVAPRTDPISGQPASKSSPVRVERYPAAWYGFALTRERPRAIPAGYWAMARIDGGHRLELADERPLDDARAFAAALFGVEVDDPGVEWTSLSDAATGRHRFAALREGRIVGALFVDRRPPAVSRAWAAATFGAGTDASGLVAGRAREGGDPGRVVCACFAVGSEEIARLVRSGAATTVAEVGALIRAGSNCGSCKTEIARIVGDTRAAAARVTEPA